VLAGVHKRLAAMWPWPVAALAPLAVLAVLPVRPLVLVASAAAGLSALPTAEIVRRARLALERYGFTRAEPVAARVVKEPHATPAFSPQAAQARPGADAGIAGLAFAGDWTATGLPATIEGAVQSGITAARAILPRPTATEVPA